MFNEIVNAGIEQLVSISIATYPRYLYAFSKRRAVYRFVDSLSDAMDAKLGQGEEKETCSVRVLGSFRAVKRKEKT